MPDKTVTSFSAEMTLESAGWFAGKYTKIVGPLRCATGGPSGTSGMLKGHRVGAQRKRWYGSNSGNVHTKVCSPEKRSEKKSIALPRSCVRTMFAAVRRRASLARLSAETFVSQCLIGGNNRPRGGTV